MKLFNFVIIKLTICYIIGILIGVFYPVNLKICLFGTCLLFLLLIIKYLNQRISINNSIWFGLLTFLTMISIGILNTSLHNDKQFNNHYSNFVNNNDTVNSAITFRVREVLKPSNYHNKYVIDVLSTNSVYAIGKSLLNVTKAPNQNLLHIDDIIMTRSQFKELTSPRNPYQFNYKNYLNKQQIYHEVFVLKSELFTVSNHKHTIFGFAAKLREHIQLKLKAYNFDTDEYAIINALLLGQRQDISKEIYDSYAQAGAIHILAVSGLHVGIILVLLNYLLKPFEFIKHGKYIKISLIVIILWSFAIIAGLSASVTRAVTMFTIIAIAMHLKRPTNIYNTLAISVFVLLLFKPNFMFDVGFQLSYLAVIAIVTVQPVLFKLYRPKYKLDTIFWNIFTVTLAAQVGVLPLSLYYFHQFPGLFFLSNLIIIPFLGIILGMGIVVLTLASLSILPKFIANIYSFIIENMNDFVQWISQQEAFLFQNISFNLVQTVLSYSIIATVFYVVIKKKFKSTLLLLTTIITTQIYLIFLTQSQRNQEFIIFHKSRYTILGFRNNDTMNIHHNLNDSILGRDKTINNYNIGKHIKNSHFDTLQDVYEIKNKKLLIIDSLGVYKSLSFKPNIILLRNSPKVNLVRLIDSLQPDLIICDGSNYRSYQNRWEQTCEAKKIPFHRTSEKGAYIFKY